MTRGGNKLLKVITDSLAQRVTTITYVAGIVYQRTAPLSNPTAGTDTLQFIGHEEGRARWAYHKYTNGTTAYKFEYDFFERDHLGNTRTVLTQQRDTSNYIATLEATYRSTESQLFGNIANTSAAWTSMPNYANILNNIRYMYTSPNDSVSKVDSSSAGGQKVGPNLLLKVMSGDTVNLSVQCYYVSPGGGSANNSSFSDVLTSLGQGLVNLTGGAHGTLTNLTNSGSTVYTGLTSFLSNDDTAHTGYPKAYINWIFLDDQFNYVSSLSGSVLAASSTYPAGSMNLVAPGGPIALNKSGYLYIWVSNETTGWDVYFDNLSVQYKQGPLLEENHYYPFGLTMAGISDKAIKSNYAENKYRYNGGNELQNKEFGDGTGLETYDAGFRSLDPQLGRFTQVDPLADMNHFTSEYEYADNDPISANDPIGLNAQYSPAPTPLGPSYYNNSNNFGMPSIHQINEYHNFYDGMDNPDLDGGGMFQGGGLYQMPGGGLVDFATAADYATNRYGGSFYSFSGGLGQMVYSLLTGRANPDDLSINVSANGFGQQVFHIQWNTTEAGTPVVHNLSLVAGENSRDFDDLFSPNVTVGQFRYVNGPGNWQQAAIVNLTAHYLLPGRGRVNVVISRVLFFGLPHYIGVDYSQREISKLEAAYESMLATNNAAFETFDRLQDDPALTEEQLSAMWLDAIQYYMKLIGGRVGVISAKGYMSPIVDASSDF